MSTKDKNMKMTEDEMRAANAKFVAEIRNLNHLWTIMMDHQRSGPAYTIPASGKSSTETPDQNGRYSQPVYYDWGAEWKRVSDLVISDPVQKTLKMCIESVQDGYYFAGWDQKVKWPFLFNMHRRFGNGEEQSLIREHLPKNVVRDHNGLLADWLESLGEQWIAEKGIPLLVKSEGSPFLHQQALDELFMGSGANLYNEFIPHMVHKALYRKNGPLREILLCTLTSSYGFMPLNYHLATLLSPKGTRLSIYASEEYSVVVDEARNIVFDNFWYFVKVSAGEALKKSKDSTQLSPAVFDYSLGGLVESLQG